MDNSFKGNLMMPNKKQPRPRRTYMSEFKQQLVELYRSGKQKCDIVCEYDIVNSLLDKWLAQADHSGSFNEKDNRTPEQQELIEEHKYNSISFQPYCFFSVIVISSVSLIVYDLKKICPIYM